MFSTAKIGIHIGTNKRKSKKHHSYLLSLFNFTYYKIHNKIHLNFSGILSLIRSYVRTKCPANRTIWQLSAPRRNIRPAAAVATYHLQEYAPK